MEILTPNRNKNVFYTEDGGVVKVRGITMFVVVNPGFGIMFPTARAKMKDACIVCERIMESDWLVLQGMGFRVMKLFAGGYDRTDQSLASIDEWTDLDPDYATQLAKEELLLIQSNDTQEEC